MSLPEQPAVAAPGDSPPRRCAVLGSPISHSLSPALHRAAYARLGLSGWSYEAREATEAGLAEFVDQCDPSWRGLSLTMPLKVAALSLGEPDELTALVGAANTLVFTDEGRRLYNTDVDGLVAAVRRATPTELTTVTVLGAGATARSSLASAARLGVTEVTVVARDLARAESLRALAEACGLRLSLRAWDRALPTADLVVSTVTAGAADARAAEVAASATVVFDAIYDPWPTPLTLAALRAGRTVVDGLDLLCGQAVLQIRLMTGHDVDPSVLRDVGVSALGARSPGEQASAAGAPR